MAEGGEHVDRRKLLKRAVVGAGLVWSTPLVTSLPAAAQTASPPPAGGGGGGGGTIGLGCGVVSSTSPFSPIRIPAAGISTIAQCEAALGGPVVFPECADLPGRVQSICLNGTVAGAPLPCPPSPTVRCRPSGRLAGVEVTNFVANTVCEGFRMCQCVCG